MFSTGSIFAWFLSDSIKRRPDFCVSCHLANNKSLHEEKHKGFNKDISENLAGAHRLKGGEGFSCKDCHTGRSAGLILKIGWLEFSNTVYHFFGDPKEPKKLDPDLMPDANCVVCHANMDKGMETFHGMMAHKPKVKVFCVQCHVTHPAGRKGYYFIDIPTLLEACKICHPQLSPAFLRILPKNDGF